MRQIEKKPNSYSLPELLAPAGSFAHLTAAIGEDAGTIEDVCEPFLIQRGLIKRTPRGRALTPYAYEHLGLPVPEDVY